jgi:hypothetical protein
VLYGWDPETKAELGWEKTYTITYKLTGVEWDIAWGYCALGIRPRLTSMLDPSAQPNTPRIIDAIERRCPQCASNGMSDSRLLLRADGSAECEVGHVVPLVTISKNKHT